MFVKWDWVNSQYVYSLHCGGDVQPPEACGGELARVDVGDLGHGCVDAVHILSFHNQHRLGRVEMELDTQTQKAIVLIQLNVIYIRA